MQFLSLGLDLSIPDRPWTFTLGIFNLQVIVSLGWRIGPVSFYIAPSVEVPLPKYKTARTSFRD